MVETREQAATPPVVRATRTIRASRQRVYRAWTDPELLMRWFIEPDGNMRVLELDLRTGGRYRLEGAIAGNPWAIWGVYREVTPPSRLVYTWSWDNDYKLGEPRGEDTVVTVEFRERGRAETEVVVTHERLTTETARAEHQSGWIGCLERLGEIAEELEKEKRS